MAPRTRTRKVESGNYSGLSMLGGQVLKSESIEQVFPVLKSQSSRQAEDEFRGFYGGSTGDFNVLEPLYPPSTLNRYAIASGVLKTCIEAMATNIDGFGYTLEYIGPEGGQDGAEAKEEHDRVTGVLDHPNGEYSLIDLRKRFRIDKESCGYGTIEIVRNADDGFPDTLHHVPSYTIRVTTQEAVATDARRYMPRPGSKDNMILVKTRFRRFLQSTGANRVYFRENGDTRAIDVKTGRASGGPGAEDVADVASDIVFDAHYAPGSRYGAPRWIGELRSVLGLQESENTNLGYFKDNGIPAMMMLVLGGALSSQSQQEFKGLIQQARGAGMQNKIVMLEIKGDEMAASDKGQIQRPEVKLEPLLQVRQQDAFFQNYEQNSAKKIRSSFRLPAIFTGLTEEVRYAVAQASLTLAESQVFGPERNQTDDLFNYQILTYNGEPMRYWRFKSNPPRIQDAAEVMDAIDTLESVGAMTPNIAIGFANTLFDSEIPLIDQPWGDMPFALTTANQIDQTDGDIDGTPDDGAQEPPSAVKGVRKRVRKGEAAPDKKAAPARRLQVRKRHRDHGRDGLTLRTRKREEEGPRKTFGRGMKAGTAASDPLAGNYVEERSETDA